MSSTRDLTFESLTPNSHAHSVSCHLGALSSMHLAATRHPLTWAISHRRVIALQVSRDLAAGRLPPVQPFHAMAYPFNAKLALAISAKYAEYCALTAVRLSVPQLPHPPAQRLAPGQRLRVAYVSSDFGNHPLSHLMASVFGGHDRSRVSQFTASTAAVEFKFVQHLPLRSLFYSVCKACAALALGWRCLNAQNNLCVVASFQRCCAAGVLSRFQA